MQPADTDARDCDWLEPARRVFEQRLRAFVEDLRSLEASDAQTPREGEVTIAEIEEHAAAIVEHEVDALGKELINTVAALPPPYGRVESGVAGAGEGRTASRSTECNIAIAEAIAEVWPWSWDADGRGHLAQAIEEASAAVEWSEEADNTPLLTRVVREFYWRSSLPVFEAHRAWMFVESVANGAAFRFLRDAALQAIDAQATDEQCDEVAKAVMQHVRAMRDELGMNAPAPPTSAEATQRAGALNTGFAASLEHIGKKGGELAGKVRAKLATAEFQEDEWKFWRFADGSASFLLLLAKALWVDVVEPDLARRSRRRPAIVRAVVADRLLPLMTRQAQFPELDDGLVCDARGRVIGQISLQPVSLTTDAPIEVVRRGAQATLESVRRGAHALGTVTGNRMLRALIHRSHEAWNRGDQDPRRVAFEGGWAGLLDAVGVSQNNHSAVQEIAQAGQCIVWQTAHAKHGGLWTWTERRGTKAAAGEVAFVLGDALTPGYGDTLSREGSSLGARKARRLVPELRYEPPMGGARPNDHGAIWTLHRLMLVELVDHAEELHASDAVVISRPKWRELASAAGVSTSIVDRTLDAWVAGESDTAPALLERLEPDAWTLAKPHGPERDFIAAGGAKRLKGRERVKEQRRRRRS